VLVHSLFDLLAWIAAAAMAWWIGRRGWLTTAIRLSPGRDPGYFIALSLGAIAGAVLIGSLNLDLAGQSLLGHSIAGALFGGVTAVELFKRATGMRGSTGVRLVAPLAIGIAVGRLGCFFAGLPDYTYGVATGLPWGVDFGDGIHRHPVQLYESLAMLGFLAVFLAGIARSSRLFLRQGFYLFVGWYALQRFAWEFLKPYPTVAGPLNLFHLVCLVLLAYSAFMLWQSHEPGAAQ
jgi:phosphatidylglycerol---prolipoprotein diacylglyceryl transferase